MKRYFVPGLVILIALTSFFSCKKVNLASDVGLGVIPEVDNIHTFDTTLEVSAFNHIFTAANDSFHVYGAYEQFLGVITNDPLFGKTDARMYFNVSLPHEKFAFQNVPGKVVLDSVVLIMNYLETYGDTSMPQTIRVSELAQSNNFRLDTNYTIRKSDWVTSGELGSKTIVPFTLRDSVRISAAGRKAEEDSATSHQLRIRLSDAFGNRLLSYDTTGSLNAFVNDSVFNHFFKGFELRSVSGGNAILGFNLPPVGSAEAGGSKLAVYYRYEDKTTAGKLDATVQYFRVAPRPVANYISRDYTGTQVAATSDDAVPDNLVYIQGTPGTYATLKIPGIKNLKNSIIHLAELQMQSVYDQQDTLFSEPKALFLDAYNPTSSKYMTIPGAVQVSGQGTFGGAPFVINNYGSFGSYPARASDLAGKSIRQWRFNLTRYVQEVVTKILPTDYDLRLYAPAHILLANGNSNQSSLSPVTVQPLSIVSPGKGRVRLGGGQHSSQKMKLRIVYSKL